MAEESLDQLKARIQRLEEENRKWMRLAGVNHLTKLPNSLMLFQVVLPKELAKDKGAAFSLACILICPDKLGDINQNHGRGRLRPTGPTPLRPHLSLPTAVAPADADPCTLSACPFVHRTTGNAHIAHRKPQKPLD